jgi:hypothetical protein
MINIIAHNLAEAVTVFTPQRLPSCAVNESHTSSKHMKGAPSGVPVQGVIR